MPRFFVSEENIDKENARIVITGDDAFHISRSLRMASGEHITVCDGVGHDYECVLSEFSDTVTAAILSVVPSSTEPPFSATLFQALPKGDKLDSIIAKSVECGVSEIDLFGSEHCIVKYSNENDSKKSARRCRIAAEAAKQCGRGIIPAVNSPVSFDIMLKKASRADLPLFCYEGNTDGVLTLGEILRSTEKRSGMSISIVVGPEGGFSSSEVERAKQAGMLCIGLGKRILRTETVAPFVLGALVCHFEL